VFDGRRPRLSFPFATTDPVANKRQKKKEIERGGQKTPQKPSGKKKIDYGKKEKRRKAKKKGQEQRRGESKGQKEISWDDFKNTKLEKSVTFF